VRKTVEGNNEKKRGGTIHDVAIAPQQRPAPGQSAQRGVQKLAGPAQVLSDSLVCAREDGGEARWRVLLEMC
jgi:hypothetical protein